MKLVLRKKSHFIVVICSVLVLLPLAYSSSVAEIDITATFYKVIDGDTFDTSRGRIRLADVDAPDNDSEAKGFLQNLLENAPHKQVYLDIDDCNVTDRYNRVVCLVYVRHNSTHLKNVNKALLDKGLVNITDYCNEFNPDRWTVFAYYPDSSKNYREVLLDFLTNELVAHGAMFFAASTATFIFFSSVLDKLNEENKSNTDKKKKEENPKTRAVIVFILSIGILVGLTIFLGFRVLYYGALTNGAIRVRPPTEYESLSNYLGEASNLTKDGFPFGENLFETLKEGSHYARGILPISISYGLLIAYILLWAFGDKAFKILTPKRDFTGLLVPVVIGSVRARYFPPRVFCSWDVWILALYLSYAIVVVVILFWRNIESMIQGGKEKPPWKLLLIYGKEFLT